MGELTVYQIHDRVTLIEHTLLYYRQELDQLKNDGNKNLAEFRHEVKAINKQFNDINKKISDTVISIQRWAITLLVAMVGEIILVIFALFLKGV
jgi:predicted PurR-regulated permease PerM